MNKDEALTEVDKILKLGSAVGKDLSKTLGELKNEIVIHIKKLAVTNYNRHPDVISVVYSSGSHGSNSAWWPVCADIELYDKNRKIEGSKTFYDYIKKAYDVGFVELLLNPETGEKTNRWDIVEIAIFNWMFEEAKLFNWEVNVKEEIEQIDDRTQRTEQGREMSKPKVLVPEHYRESGSDIEKVMLATHFNVFLSELPPNLAAELKAEPSAKNALSKALWAAMAMKHLCRAGTKADNPVDLELGKVENYSHRARTGEWE